MKQYFYKNDACKAISSLRSDCICWHDKGTGPQPEKAEGNGGWREGETEWRDKPGTERPLRTTCIRCGADWNNGQISPVGYVVALVDTSSAPNGEWFVGAYHDKDLAESVAAKNPGTRVRPIAFLAFLAFLD